MIKKMMLMVVVMSLVLSSTMFLNAEQKKGKKSARDLYYEAPQGTNGVKMVGIRARFYQVTPNCDFIQVSPHKMFMSGERLRFGIESNLRRGYLYVFQKGSSGKSTLLFPHPQINKGKNWIKRGVELVIPGKGWFTFDTTPGVEELTFIVSRKRLDILPYLIPAAGNTPSKPPAGSYELQIITILRGTKRKMPRDLVYTPPQSLSTPVISNEGAIYNSVYCVNQNSKLPFSILRVRLNHR